MPSNQVQPPIRPPMDQTRANRFAWAAYILGALGFIATSLIGVKFLPDKGEQVIAWLATVFNGLALYLARGLQLPGQSVPSQPSSKPTDDQ